MLTRIKTILGIPLEGTSTWLGKNVDQVIQTDADMTAFVGSWLEKEPPKFGELVSQTPKVNFHNLVNLSLLCYWIERYGVTYQKAWFKQTVLMVAKSSDLMLDVNNLEFYKRFGRKDGKQVTRTRLLNAAYSKTRDLSKKAEVYSRILEQGLICRVDQEVFKFSSKEVATVVTSWGPKILEGYRRELMISKLIIPGRLKL